MKILLAKKQFLLSFTVALITLFFTSLSFSYNPGLTYLPGRDNSATAGINEAEQGCVYRESDASLGVWTVDDCDYVGAHYACYNGAEWKVAQALGNTVNPGEPQDGNPNSNPKMKAIDRWDPIKADGLCKNYFGPAYFFSVPVNAVEDQKLGGAIAKIVAAKKRTWVHYYSNTDDIPLTKNYWLGNRTEFTNWFGSNPDNKASSAGIADCTLIHRDTGLWQDASCSEAHSFACFESGEWLITSEQGGWRDGFSVCDEKYGALSLYGVPRNNAENEEIRQAALPSAGTGIAADYNQVWLNRTDLAFEEFFISNQTRRAWWGEGQPTNQNNADCTLIDSAGNWIAETCNGYVAYHACYLGDSSSGQAQWQLTKDIPGLKMAESTLGFGYCKRLDENGEYRPPNSTASNDALAGLLSAGEYVWINYSDQESEGAWKVSNQYQDFVSLANVIDGDAKDCGYFSLETNDKGNWLAGQCYAGGTSINQGFACTNGYEWKVATESLAGDSLTSDLWKDGFTACEAAFGKDYHFAAPASADQNSRLSLALSLSGNTHAWMNLNDAKSEGSWVSNGPVVNLSPVLTLSSQREFSEKEIINLSVAALDPETGNNIGLTYQWSIIAQRVGDSGTGTDIVVAPTLTNENTPNVTLSATDLLNDNYYLDIQLQVTDADVETPATTTTVITIKVISPLRAAYDFNNYTNPKLDRSGNNHSLILNTSQIEIMAHGNGLNDYFAKLDSSDSFSIDGSVSGLQLDETRDQYTLIYRFKLDSVPSSDWAGFVQKGDVGSRQPALFYNKSTNKIQFNNSTTVTTPTAYEAELSLEAVRLDQWMTVAYVKNGSDSKLYIDKAELNEAEPDPTPLNAIPDTTRPLLGTSVGYASGNWTFGNVPDASEGIIGGLDDIRIYDRSLTALELNKIFSDQPRGVFEFTNLQEEGNENTLENAVTEVSIPVSRITGDDGIVSVAFNLKSGSALLDTDFRLKNDPKNLGDPERGQGVLTWQVHDVADKDITIEIIGDSLREGTESFTVELEGLGGTEPGLGNNSTISVNVIDKTPNPYGAIAIAPTTATQNIAVDEGQSGLITVERVGTDSLGAFDVIYQVEALTAASPEDFSITQAGFPIPGTVNGNVLGQGRLSFPSNNTGAPVDKQLQTISFNTTPPGVPEFDELFSVTLIDVTDPGVLTLANPLTSAILGTKRGYTQKINDITPGRISFSDANYTGDEVDQGDDSNVVLISLKRLAGNDGALCVELDTAGSSADSADYSISYLNPSASGQSDIYWSNQDADEKFVQVTIVDDQAYDADEFLNLSWVRKANCNGEMTAIPDFDTGDLANTTLSIVDHTEQVSVRFGATSYSVSERGSSLQVSIQATQGTDFSEGNRTNKNAFSIYLNPSNGSAIEGVDFDDLAGLKVVTFSASGAGATEQVVSIPINDNCDAIGAKQFSMSLLKVHSNLPTTLPVDLIDVTSPDTTIEIVDESTPIIVTGYASVSDVTNPAKLSGGRYLVTGDGTVSGGFASSKLKLVATDATVDDCPLTYTWKYINAVPSLPVAGIENAGSLLPSNFSSFAHIKGNDVSASASVDEFLLPFIVDNTTLNYELKVEHPERADKVIDVPVLIAANWSRLKNDRGWCTNVSGSRIGTSNNCSSATNRNFIFNPGTGQVIGKSLYGGKYGCWQAVDGGDDDVLYRACSNEARQVITFSGGSGDNVQSSDGRDLVDTLSWFTERGLRSLSGGNSGGQSANRKHWFWEN